MHLQDAHLGIQVENLEQACALLSDLFGLTSAEPITGGLDERGGYRYTYHDVAGLRVQMAAAAARPAFERWAVTGEAEGVPGEFELTGTATDGGALA